MLRKLFAIAMSFVFCAAAAVPSCAGAGAPAAAAAVGSSSGAVDSTTIQNQYENLLQLARQNADYRKMGIPQVGKTAQYLDLFTGSAAYDIPLPVPAGRHGVQPSLTLSYSSLSHPLDSTVGYGWSLVLPSIYRMQDHGVDGMYGHDDYAAQLWDSYDELLKQPDGTYAPKVEGSYVSYTASSTGWTAIDREGRQYTFGETHADTKDATKIYRWYLTQYTDTLGNTLQITYTHDLGQVYPSHITYAAFDIGFVYENRQQPYLSYATGFAVTTTQRLKTITIATGGKVVRSIGCAYATTTTAFELLTSVTVFGGSESRVLGSFTYFTGAEGGKWVNLLKTVTEPAGGVLTYAYQPSTAVKTPQGARANTKLPFVVQTLQSVTKQACATCTMQVTNYAYEGGHYFVDQHNVFRREYAGFRKVIAQDSLGNSTLTYFYQSQYAPVVPGLTNDDISKKGKAFRVETRDTSGTLLAATQSVYDTVQLSSGRAVPRLTRQVQYAYEGGTTPRVSAVEYAYDTYGNVITQTDYGEVTSTDGYAGMVDSGADVLTSTTTYAQNVAKHILGVPADVLTRNQRGATVGETQTYYDGAGLGVVIAGNPTRRAQLIAGATYATTAIAYTPEGLVQSTTDANLHTTTYTYDTTKLYPITSTNAKGQITTYAYDLTTGTPTSVTDANGLVSATILDGIGRPLRLQKNGNNVVTMQYNLSDAVPNVRVTEILSTTLLVPTVFCFDGFLRPTETRRQADTGVTVTARVYDVRGLVAQETAPVADTGLTCSGTAPAAGAPGTLTTYDALGRVSTVQTPLGTTTTTYAPWETHVVNARNIRKDMVLDARGNMVQVREYVAGNPMVTTYAYTAQNKISTVTDSAGNVRNLTYDLLGRLLAEEDLHTATAKTIGQKTYIYDAVGNMIRSTDERGTTVLRTYDALNRLLTESVNGTVQTSMTYDSAPHGIGHVASSISPGEAIAYTYNSMENIGTENATIDDTSYQTMYTYDLQGNITGMTLPGNVNFQYGFGGAGLPTTISQGGRPLVTVAARVPMLAPGTITYGDGSIQTDTYDPAKNYFLVHRSSTSGATTLQNITYTYDATGNILTLADTGASASSTTFMYDDLGRLLSAALQVGTTTTAQTYTYDRIGNILTASDTGAYTYAGTQPEEVTNMGAAAYSYDAAGNMITTNGWKLTYDYRNHITAATKGAAVVYFSYDQTGRRTLKSIPSAHRKSIYINQYYEIINGEPQYHAFLGNERVVTLSATLEYPTCKIPTATAKAPVIWTPTVNCMVHGTLPLPYTTLNLPPTAHASAQDAGTTLIQLTTPALRTIYHHIDHLTGASVDTDSAGKILYTTAYYPYGAARTAVSVGEYAPQHTYTDKEKDFDTGLFDYGARYYDPILKRFVSSDPWAGDITDPQSLNKYSYVEGNPVRYMDPSGMTIEDYLGGVLGGFLSTFSTSSPSIPDNGDFQQGYISGSMGGAAVGATMADVGGGMVSGGLAVTPSGILAPEGAVTAAIGAAVGAGGGYMAGNGADHVVEAMMQRGTGGGGNGSQSIEQLQKGIQSLEDRISDHNDKIAHPENIDMSQAKGDPEQWKQGLLNHWQKEIQTFQKEIDKKQSQIQDIENSNMRY